MEITPMTTSNPLATEERTDTERLDFIEAYLQREGFVDDALRVKVRVWTIATQAENPEGLRATIDLMIDQRGKLQNG